MNVCFRCGREMRSGCSMDTRTLKGGVHGDAGVRMRSRGGREGQAGSVLPFQSCLDEVEFKPRSEFEMGQW
jgi:hypothetical protein